MLKSELKVCFDFSALAIRVYNCGWNVCADSAVKFWFFCTVCADFSVRVTRFWFLWMQGYNVYADSAVKSILLHCLQLLDNHICVFVRQVTHNFIMDGDYTKANTMTIREINAFIVEKKFNFMYTLTSFPLPTLYPNTRTFGFFALRAQSQGEVSP